MVYLPLFLYPSHHFCRLSAIVENDDMLKSPEVQNFLSHNKVELQSSTPIEYVGPLVKISRRAKKIW